MATLIIPDVHERMDRLAEALRDRLPLADRVVFLGDWFDAFGAVDLAKVAMSCEFLNGNIDGLFHQPEDNEEPGRLVPATFLLGNHDCHYFYEHDGFKCSGYNIQKQEVVWNTLDWGHVVPKFRICTQVGPYLVSHAGYTKATLGYSKPSLEAEALQSAQMGHFDPMFAPGRARGGWAAQGGPTWLDWNVEFKHIDGTPQIVGHTHGSAVRTKGLNIPIGVDVDVESARLSWCFDTALHYIGWVDEATGEVRAEKVSA